MQHTRMPTDVESHRLRILALIADMCTQGCASLGFLVLQTAIRVRKSNFNSRDSTAGGENRDENFRSIWEGLYGWTEPTYMYLNINP